MFYNNIENLELIEKRVCDNLSTADCLNDSNDPKALKVIWINYRADVATLIGVLREYKELLAKVKND